MEKNYAHRLDKYQISQELWVSYAQKYDENKKTNEKISLDDLTIVTITETNYNEMKRKYRHLDLPIFNKKKFLKAGVIWIRVFDGKKVVATVEVWKAELAIRENVAPFDTEPYDKSKTYLQDLSVRKEYQGKGLGRQLVKYLIKNYNIGYLEVFAEGEVAAKLYQSEGFKPYYTHEDGIVFMKR